MDVSLPNVRMPLIDDQGCMTSPYYRYFQNANQSSGQSEAQLQSEIEQIATALGSPDGTVANIPDVNFNNFLPKSTTIEGRDAISSSGSLSSGLVILSLQGDVENPPSLSFYGSMTGGRGWQEFTSNFANASGELDLSKPGNSGAGTLQAVTVDAFGRITGTRAATITGTANQIDVANGDGSAGAPTISLDAAVLNQLAALIGSPGLGYIDGLNMVWNSATSLSVTSGAAYIPSLGHVLQSPATLTLSSLVLTASTWYHIYLYLNSGTPAIECVTTAPAAPYNGNARAKTGDTSRRYIGSIKSDTSGNVINFDHNAMMGAVYYKTNLNNNGLLALSNGSATTNTIVSLSAGIPVTANQVYAFFDNSGTGTPVVFVSSADIAASTIMFYLRPAPSGTSTEVKSFLSVYNQSIAYQFTGSPTSGGLSCYIAGYTYTR